MDEHVEVRNHVLTQDSFPFRICDVTLPQCNTGYVYMLISMKDKSFIYIGKTKSLRKRIKKHNSGIGSVSTEPLNLRPYALLAYICGFDLRDELMSYVEQTWKLKRDNLIRNCCSNPLSGARSGGMVANDVNVNNYAVEKCELTLVCMFND